MGSIAQDAHAVLLLADYIGMDNGGKFNLMGAGFGIAGWQAGQTAPMYLAVMIDVPGRHASEKFTWSVELRDVEADQLVVLPGPTGQAEPVRFAQAVVAERPTSPELVLPPDLPGRVQMQFAFPNGMPLSPGRRYRWRLAIDNTFRKNWVANFYVPEPPAPPVYGGPNGPGAIEGVEQIPDEEDPLEEL